MLVKASYFPNWKASGARGPWRVTPNQMVVIPTSRHVTLHYRNTPVDLAGWLLTYLGVVGVVLLSRRRITDRDDAPPPRVERVLSPPAWEFAPELEPQPA